MTDEALITLAQHRFDVADSEEASRDDCRQLRDIFPAVLQRLREKVELTRSLIGVEQSDMTDPKEWQRLATTGGKNETDDQLQLALTHL